MRQTLINARGSKSKATVAKDLSITPQYLGYIEEGKRTPSMALALLISKYYSISVENLFFNNDVTNRY